MNESTALDQLSDRYTLALRMLREGISNEAIGRILAIDPAAVPALLTLAKRKLAELEEPTGRADQSTD
jgi:DNA-binding CsgD family transcriptional regulator